MEATFTPRDAIRFGWETTQRHLPVFLGLALLQILLTSLEGAFGRMPHGSGALLRLAAQAAGLALAMGWWRIALRAHDGEPVSLAMVAEVTLPQYLQYFLTTVLMAIAVAIGLLMFVLPGLVAVARFSFAPLLVIDERLDAVSAMKRSAELTRGATVELVVFGLWLLGLNLLGLLALGVGLLVTMPVSVVAAAYVYRRFAARAVHGAPHTEAGTPLGASS